MTTKVPKASGARYGRRPASELTRRLQTIAVLLPVCLLLASCAPGGAPMPGATASRTSPPPQATAPSPEPSHTLPPTGPVHNPTPSAGTETPATALSGTPSPAPAETPGPTDPPGAANGVVILAFADSKAGVYTVAYPLMARRNVRGLVYLNVDPIERQLPGRLTVAQLDEMDAAGWDIASHGYTHEDPTQMAPDALARHLKWAQEWLLERGYARGARHYGPPSNNCNQGTLDAAAQTYDTVWCREFSRLPAGYRFGVVACGDNIAWDRLQVAFDKLAGDPGRVLRCSFHDLVPENPTGNQADRARMEQILDYLESKQIRVVTLSDLLDGTGP